LRAVTPPHAEDVVEVEVRLGATSYKSSFAFGFVRPREQLLIPVALDIPGAHGSRWMTDVWVFNDSDEMINLFPEVCSFIGAIFSATSFASTIRCVLLWPMSRSALTT